MDLCKLLMIFVTSVGVSAGSLKTDLKEDYLHKVQHQNLSNNANNSQLDKIPVKHLALIQIVKWHWHPYKKEMLRELGNGTIVKEIICDSASSVDDFPEDLFTDEQLRNGAIILHFIAGVYCFTLLAVVCNDYFIPSVQCICEDLHISPDVAAATFMSVATSCPELFVNVISTFVTESDMGLGTIVGSAMFNTLGVGALGGLTASKVIPIEQWPLTRDCLIYTVVISMLVAIAWDGLVHWYEATALLVMYVLYFVLMFQNERIQRILRTLTRKLCHRSEIGISGLENNNHCVKNADNGLTNQCYVSTEESGVQNKTVYVIPIKKDENNKYTSKIIMAPDSTMQVDIQVKTRRSLWRVPDGTWLKKSWWLYTWPIKMLLTMTIPSPKTWRKLYPFSFFMCIVWIGVNAYLVFWMVAVIGVTIGVPDSVMGMTFLAAGGCLPEAISIVIMSRKGEGAMGVSNSLGANTLAVLMSLGLPWFIKTFRNGISADSYVHIESGGVVYTIISLILAIWALYAIVRFGGFTLRKRTGFILMLTYLVFVILAILAEMGIFFDTCG